MANCSSPPKDAGAGPQTNGWLTERPSICRMYRKGDHSRRTTLSPKLQSALPKPDARSSISPCALECAKSLRHSVGESRDLRGWPKYQSRSGIVVDTRGRV